MSKAKIALPTVGIDAAQAADLVAAYGSPLYVYDRDRLGKHGSIALITHCACIAFTTFDGFRQCVDREFDYGYSVDTQADLGNHPQISGTKKVWDSDGNCGDVFG